MGRTWRESADEELELLREAQFNEAYRHQLQNRHGNHCGDIDALPWCNWCEDQTRKNNPELFLKYRNALIGKREKEDEECHRAYLLSILRSPPVKRSHFRWSFLMGRLRLVLRTTPR